MIAVAVAVAVAVAAVSLAATAGGAGVDPEAGTAEGNTNAGRAAFIGAVLFVGVAIGDQVDLVVGVEVDVVACHFAAADGEIAVFACAASDNAGVAFGGNG